MVLTPLIYSLNSINTRYFNIMPTENRKQVILALLILSMILVVGAAYAYALTESEAEAKFQQLGCVNCHKEGGVAPTFDGVVDEIKDWAKEYPTIDAAVKAEHNEDSFDDLMDEMAANAGVDPSQVTDLKEFFEGVYNEAKASAGGGGGEAGGLPFSPVELGVIIVIIVIVLAIAFYLLRKK